MSKKLIALVALVLGASALTGCGTTPAATGLQTKTSASVTAKDYYSTTRARQIATDALYQYDNLRDQWQRAYSDSEKDRIEQRMLDTLTRAASDVRRTASSGSGYDAREIYNVADRAISQYENLRYRWQQAYGDREKREIVNDMLTGLTQALKDVQRVR